MDKIGTWLQVQKFLWELRNRLVELEEDEEFGHNFENIATLLGICAAFLVPMSISQVLGEDVPPVDIGPEELCKSADEYLLPRLGKAGAAEAKERPDEAPADSLDPPEHPEEADPSDFNLAVYEEEFEMVVEPARDVA